MTADPSTDAAQYSVCNAPLYFPPDDTGALSCYAGAFWEDPSHNIALHWL